MRKIVVGAFMSLDGVMQAPGGPEEEVSPNGAMIASYARAGEVKTGSFAMEQLTVAEIERRRHLK
jgi:hypothetical protein